MPIQPFHYAGIQPHIINGPLHDMDFGALLKQGMQLRHEPQRLLEEREQAALSKALGNQSLERGQVESEFQRPMLEGKLRSLQQANELQIPMGLSKINAQEQKAYLDKLKAGLYPHQAQADILYKNARAKSLGGPQSDIGKMQSDYEKIVQEKGEKSKDAQDFKAAMDAKVTAAKNKGLTQQEKKFDAITRKEEELKNPNLTPEQKEKVRGQLATLKAQELMERVPASMFPKLQAGSIMQVLMDDIDIKDATRYSGILAKIQKKYDQSAGNKHWLKYEEAEKKMKGLATQIRAFYAGSVQPKEMQRLIDFLDGNDWSLDPQQAASLMRSAFSVLTKEHIKYVENAGNLPNLLVPAKNKYEDTIPEINTSGNWSIKR